MDALVWVVVLAIGFGGVYYGATRAQASAKKRADDEKNPPT